MRRSDSYSTPARRRRIINDVTKSVLRQYYIAACNNVLRFRIETHASVVIQTRVRGLLARRTLQRLVFKKQTAAAVKIQAVWRMKLARMLRRRLYKALRLKQATRLALCVQTLYRNRKERLHRIALMIARRLAMEKRRQRAAVDVQRVFRGMLGRRRTSAFVAARRALWLKKNAAAVVIQSRMRCYLARIAVRVRRARKLIRRIQLRLKLDRWRRFSVRHLRAVVLAQTAARMFVAKRRLAAYRRLLEQMRLDKCSEVRPLSPFQIPLRRDPVPIKTMHIAVDLTSDLLQDMASSGPCCVVAWSLENFILHYHSGRGYTLGAVVQQVVTSVDSLLQSHDPSAAGQSPQKSSVGGGDNVITVASWDEGQASDVPAVKYLPADWRRACAGEEGASLSVQLEPHRIELHVTVDNPTPAPVPPELGRDYSSSSELVFDFRYRVDVPPVTTCSLIVIVFNCDDQNDSGSLLDLKKEAAEFSVMEYLHRNRDLSSSSSTSAKLKDLSEAKFRFKNALVQVTTAPPAPVAPAPPLSPERAEAALPASPRIVFDDELSDEDDLDEKFLQSPVRDEAPSARPQTATVVRIVLKDPTPPPIDYNHMARRIQFMFLRWWDLMRIAAEIIQSMFYHHHMKHRWQSLARQILNRAHASAATLQRVARCRQARRRLAALRADYRYCPDFSLDEETNWQSFGMLSKTFCGNYFSPPPLIVKDNRLPAASGSGSRLHSSTNPVGQLLDIIQLPGPPPGCVLGLDPLVLLPPLSSDGRVDFASTASANPSQFSDQDCYFRLRSDNASVRHAALRAAMLPSVVSEVSFEGSIDAKNILGRFAKGTAATAGAPIADQFGNVFSNRNNRNEWNGAFQDDSSSPGKVLSEILPVIRALAGKYNRNGTSV